jgi:UPF0755 protein
MNETTPAPRKRRGRVALILLGLILAVLIALGATAKWAREVYEAPGPLVTERAVVIPRGGTEAIAGALKEAGIIADARHFLVASQLTKGAGPLRAAEFAFPAGASLKQVLEILREARPVQRRVTIPEGLSALQIQALLGEAEPIAEGSILPETYAFEFGDSRAGLIRRAQAAMNTALAEAWRDRAPNLPLRSAREALILASIIERETGKAEERALVASVFINRLRRNMPLQSDPTVVYAALGGAALDRPITRADLDRDSPFNTYRNRGLPPGPIANPGRDSLRAATKPATSNFLYFVADGSGGHAFAETLEAHNRNVARWREIERQRGAR